MKYFVMLTWAWLIILGALMITPNGVVCIACGALVTRLIGIVSVVLGVVAFVGNQRAVQR